MLLMFKLLFDSVRSFAQGVQGKKAKEGEREDENNREKQ
jgi:hypothetical protein